MITEFLRSSEAENRTKPNLVFGKILLVGMESHIKLIIFSTLHKAGRHKMSRRKHSLHNNMVILKEKQQSTFPGGTCVTELFFRERA